MIRSIPFAHLLIKVIDNRGKTCPTSDSGIPLIATNCVKNSTLYPTFEKVRYVGTETYHAWFRGHPQPGDIIIVTKGSPGQLCLAPNPVNFCIAQDMVAVRANPSLIYPPYLFAALRSDIVQNDIANMHVGTLIPHFKKGDFDKLKIPVPPENVQEFTGDIYLRLSEKIDLNRQMNETLRPVPNSPVSVSWLYYLLNTVQTHQIVSGFSNGSTVNMLPIEALQRPEFPAPPPGLVSEFDRIATAALARNECNFAENRNLAMLRDLLLPKLMSGEIRIKDAEREVAAAL